MAKKKAVINFLVLVLVPMLRMGMHTANQNDTNRYIPTYNVGTRVIKTSTN